MVLAIRYFNAILRFCKLWLPDWRFPHSLKIKRGTPSHFQKTCNVTIDCFWCVWHCSTRCIYNLGLANKYPILGRRRTRYFFLFLKLSNPDLHTQWADRDVRSAVHTPLRPKGKLHQKYAGKWNRFWFGSVRVSLEWKSGIGEKGKFQLTR